MFQIRSSGYRFINTSHIAVYCKGAYAKIATIVDVNEALVWEKP